MSNPFFASDEVFNVFADGIFEPNRAVKEPPAIAQKGVFKFVGVPVVEVLLD
jgi:hypothetical protein